MVTSCAIIGITICAYVLCYCKNQISAGQIGSKSLVRRRQIALLSSRNPIFYRETTPPDPSRWFGASPLNFRPPPPPSLKHSYLTTPVLLDSVFRPITNMKRHLKTIFYQHNIFKYATRTTNFHR